MPALIGGFGNTRNKIYTNFCNSIFHNYLYFSNRILNYNFNRFYLSLPVVNQQIGYYLAGLIEGDGSITVPKKEKSDKEKSYHPIIRIVFNSKDVNLAVMLKERLNLGHLQKSKGNYYLWEIQDIKGLICMTNLINGKMRTPKIEALHRLID